MTSREFAERVGRRARKADVRVNPPLLAGLEAYYRLLESWNAKINLTALELDGAPDDTIHRLLIEPLGPRATCPRWSPCVDVGSGGGSPGIPLKLARPELDVRLVEAKTRKSAFLREAGRQLGIRLQVETSRYEALLTRPELHEAFDALTVRAVRVESRVLMGLQAFLRRGPPPPLPRRRGQKEFRRP